MKTLLHISDLHFGPPFVEAVGEALLHLAPRLNPDVIVASGDFTQRATEEQFREARRFLDRLPDVPRIVTPGNHDVPLGRIGERLFSPYRNYKAHIDSRLDYSLSVSGMCIASLNSTAPRRTIVNGRVSRWQLKACAEAFRQAPQDAMRIVVAHHHFAPAPDYEGGDVMPKARRALDHFQHMGVELILGGHLHRAYVGNSLDVYAGTKRDRGIIIAQSGTTTSRRGRAREREKNSFNLIQIRDEMIAVTQYMYFEKSDRFGPSGYHEFPRGRKAILQGRTILHPKPAEAGV